MISNLPGIVYKCQDDAHWTMLYLSDGVKAMTGYLPDELLMNKCISFNEIIHPDFQEIVQLKWKQAIESNHTFKDEYKIINKNGEERWVWEQGSAIYDVSGQIKHIEGFISDITEKKRNEERSNLTSSF